MSSRQNNSAAFPDTRWTIVLDTHDNDPEKRRKALEHLCGVYWLPLYAFARWLGKSPEQAEDLTQGFLLQVLENDLFGRADESIGRLRSYLRTAFSNYVRNEHRTDMSDRRGGKEIIVSFGDVQHAEEELGRMPADGRSPDVLYEHVCAVALVNEAFEQLHQSEASAGRGDAFQVLRPIIMEIAERGEQLAEAALQLRMTPGAVRQALFRLRKEFRHQLRVVVRDTLDKPSDKDVDDEVRALRQALVL